jgi:hypothetical protein
MRREEEWRGGLRAGVEVRRVLGEAEEVERRPRARLWATALVQRLEGGREGVGDRQWPLLPSNDRRCLHRTRCTTPSYSMQRGRRRPRERLAEVTGVREVNKAQACGRRPWGLPCLRGTRGRFRQRRYRGAGPAAGVVVIREDGRWLRPVHRSDGQCSARLRDPRPASICGPCSRRRVVLGLSSMSSSSHRHQRDGGRREAAAETTAHGAAARKEC